MEDARVSVFRNRARGLELVCPCLRRCFRAALALRGGNVFDAVEASGIVSGTGD